MWSGDDTVATSPTEPTSPRASTGTPVNGSMWSMATDGSVGETEERDRVAVDERRDATVDRQFVDARATDGPTPSVDATRRVELPCQAGHAGTRWPRSVTHTGVVLHVGGVDELDEVGEPLGIVERRLPLALVRVDVAGHVGVHLGGDAERVVEDHRPQVVEAARRRALEPRRRPLQPVGGADVEHQEPVDRGDQLLVGQVGRRAGRRGGGCGRRCRPT